MNEHIEAWTTQVYDKASVVDPNNAHDWTSLAYGFYLGRGLSPEDALALVQSSPL